MLFTGNVFFGEFLVGDSFGDLVGDCLVGVDFEMNSGSFNLVLGSFEGEFGVWSNFGSGF